MEARSDEYLQSTRIIVYAETEVGAFMTSRLESALQLMVKYTGNDLCKFVCKVLLEAPVLTLLYLPYLR